MADEGWIRLLSGCLGFVGLDLATARATSSRTTRTEILNMGP